jgi:Icc-related predicted phosphoesterase
MKVLAISDEVAPQVYDPGIKTRFGDVDLVLGCGDLPHYYLEYVATMLHVPVYYVMGNHDCALDDQGKQEVRPGGCVDINEAIVEHGGLLIAGLEGSMRYKPGPHQSTQLEMRYKALRLSTRILWKQRFKRPYLDILVTHAPPLGIHDGRDLCHTGFYVFLQVMERHQPRYLLHGHSHIYNRSQPTMTQYDHTIVVNVYPYRVLEIPERGPQN